MKKTLSTLIAVLFILSVKGQKYDSLKKPDANILLYTDHEVHPEFPGGIDGFLKFIEKHIRYPADARKIKKQGKVVLQFIIERDGRVTHVTVMRSVFASLDQEAVRVVSNSPKWKPDIRNGKAVSVRYYVPINFTLTKQ
ncbi:energy transducer TonB [Mucilaginibacter gotjawali]|uniref:Gram-negative bacterial tonB protein n=2 Tax=Mucilaginibacter gotjawali TaxID=1550579 RepID=A0A0X8X2M6_9SPHI|nr:energy transducer TonB [Mucilaginibacter gotjawali]MBB3055800.1 protein TonB [Mucilaginibacter gotjawali]BAU54621.1 Gram-negative bacterial tonB protein [Mucilaginibacter gotjawali]